MLVEENEMSENPSNTAELRSFLRDKMLAAADGKLDAPTCRSIVNFAQQIYNTFNIELKMAAARNLNDGKDIESVKF
jgi:hypothetical protein